MAWLAVKDNAEGKLLTGMDSVVTSFDLILGQGVKFPAANFVVSIGNEQMLCSSRINDAFTVTRAYNGTSVSDHAANAKVELRVIAKHIDDITAEVDDIITFETDTVTPHLESTDLHWKEHDHSGAGNAGGSLSTSSMVIGETPGGTINGSNTAFTTASAYTTGSLRVIKNGIRLKGGGNDYTEVANGFTMVTAPATGTVLLVDYNTVPSVFATGSTSFIYSELCGGTPNGSLTAFTTASSYVSLSTVVFLDGVRMRRGVDYTETNATTITFSSAPLTGSEVLIDYQSAVSVSGNADTLDGYHLQNIMDMLHPVGSIYISVVSTSPATLFGGTWTAFGAGKTLVGINAAETEFDTVEETGGAKTMAHTHTGPNHRHTEELVFTDSYVASNGLAYTNGGTVPNSVHYTGYEGTGNTGAASNANNLQPYIVTYMWKRTA